MTRQNQTLAGVRLALTPRCDQSSERSFYLDLSPNSGKEFLRKRIAAEGGELTIRSWELKD